MKLGCVIMAAGSSVRFGTNKLLQDFLGKPLFARILEKTQGLFDKTVVVTGYEPVKAYAEKLGLLTVENRQPELGISHTIRLGLEQMQDCDGVVFAAADQPWLSRQTLIELAKGFFREPDLIHAAAVGTNIGNPCLFPKEFFAELAQLQGDTGGKKVVLCHKDRLRLHLVKQIEVLDCDTPEAMENCLKKGLKKCEKQEKTI